MSISLKARLACADAAERARACRDAALDPAAVVWIDALARALGDADRKVARAASEALVAIGRRHDVAAALRAALRSGEPQRRWHGARTLARLEPPGPELLPALVEALACGEGAVRWEAARILVDVGRLHGEVLTLLLGLLRSAEQASQRAMAAHCLRELAPDQAACAAALLDASRDPDLGVRRAALTAAAGLLDPPRALAERLREVAEADPDAASRRLAGAALAHYPPE